ncbi:MAG: hypothetical protein DHS20C15_17490 [Planctomycetota bacterium]|nr:MAG: hypothetical protein DHS20C15_17490 [Planctomycetota bacterium]
MKPLLLLTALTLGLSPALFARFDTIVQKSGRVEENVRIEDETFSEVTFRTQRGVTQKLPTADIESISYSRTSPEFSNGMEGIDGPGWEPAAQQLLLASTDEDLDDFKRATALITAANAMLLNGYYAPSAGEFDALLNDYRDSRHRPAALLGLGKALLYQSDFSAADEALKTLQTDTQARGFDQVWSLEAEFFLLLSAEAQGKSGLLEKYTELRMLTQGEHDGIANKCALRIARLLTEQTPPDIKRAVPLLDEIIDGRLHTDVDIVAGAYNSRGQIAFGLGQAALANKQDDEAKDQFEAALLDFLRVQVSYEQVRAEQPFALYYASQAFNLLGSLGAGGADADLHSRRLRATLISNFPDTEWGRKASNE